MCITSVFIFFPIETGGIMIAPRPGPDNKPLKPSCAMRPFFGVDPVLLDEKVQTLL